MSPGRASRIPATPRTTVEPSPATSPPSSEASSASVRVIMTRTLPGGIPRGGSGPARGIPALRFGRCDSVSGSRAGTQRQFLQHRRCQVESLVRVDDDPAGRVQHQVQLSIGGELLHHRPDLADDFLSGSFVLLRGPALRPPGVLHELLVVADRALQRFFLLLPARRRQDGSLVTNFGAQLVDRLLLLGRLAAPALHLAIEARLRFLSHLVFLEDSRRVNIADLEIGGLSRPAEGQRQREQHARDRQMFRLLHPAHSEAHPLEVEVAQQEVADGTGTVVAVEAVTVVEADVAEQRDLDPEADTGADLELERLDLLPLVPGVAGVGEHHAMERMNNRELLFHRVAREETA